MLLVYVIGWSVIMLLSAYLVRRHEDRLPPRLRRRKIVLDGTAMDVAPVCERVQRLRRDYVAGVRRRPNDRSRREAIHLAARKVVRGLAYVQHLEAKSDHSSATEGQVQAA